MTPEVFADILKEVELETVHRQDFGRYSVFCYSDKCAYKELWNEVNMRCRGIVIDTETLEVVCRPFDKFFNVGEHPTTSHTVIDAKLLNTPFEIYTKHDGSLINLWYHNWEWNVSSKGSMTSEHAKYAKEKIFNKYDLRQLPTGYTYIFEMITPWDTKVVDYNGMDDVILLSMFHNSWECIELPRKEVNEIATYAGFKCVDVIENITNLGDIYNRIEKGQEGFVVRFSDGLRFKAKSDWYIRAHKYISFLNPKHVLEMMRNNTVAEMIDMLPHYKTKLQEIIDSLTKIIQEIKDKVNEEWAKVIDPNNHKACAIQFEHCEHPIRSILFCRMRGKDENKALYKAVELKLVQKKSK